MRAAAMAVLLGTMVVAGCLNGAGPTDADRGDLGAAGAGQGLPTPPVADAERTAVWHEEFVTTYAYRTLQSPTNWQASQRLVADLEAAGWEARHIEYLPASTRGLPPPAVIELPTDTGIGLNVVVGVKRGQHEDAVIGWVSHYDVVETTTQGAYDDGSGTAVGVELGRAFADYDNNKTLMAIFFDGEEDGLVGSQYFAQQVLQSQAAMFHLVIGHDMVGINWPGHEWPMYQMVGEPHADLLVPVEERLYRGLLGYPEEGVEVLDVHDRNSDERRFKEAGVPILRMAGGRNASDYPQYHQLDDTVDYIHQFVGGRDHWVAGLQTVLDTTVWNMLLFDRLPHPEDPAFPAAAQALLDQWGAAPWSPPVAEGDGEGQDEEGSR